MSRDLMVPLVFLGAGLGLNDAFVDDWRLYLLFLLCLGLAFGLALRRVGHRRMRQRHYNDDETNHRP